MKNVLILCFLSLCLSVNSSMAQSSTPKAVLVSAENLISWDQTTAELGDIPQNIPAEVSFVLTNHGTEPLFIKEVKSTCGCTVPGYTKEPILPGKSTTIEATYNAKKEGAFKKVIKVYTTQSKEAIPLMIKGVVTK